MVSSICVIGNLARMLSSVIFNLTLLLCRWFWVSQFKFTTFEQSFLLLPYLWVITKRFLLDLSTPFDYNHITLSLPSGALMPHYHIIYNPNSRHGAARTQLPEVEQKLKKAGLDFDLVQTERPWHARDLAIQAVRQGAKMVVSAGGDGTANEVLNGLMLARRAGHGEVKMGVLPVGRGNDFAFSMNAPVDLDEAVSALANGHTHWIDIGHVTGGDYPQGRYFGNGVGVGFDAVVGFEALKVPQLTGFVSYLFAALKTILLYYKAPRLRIEFDGHLVEQNSLLVSIMNGRRLGGGFWTAPKGVGDDGLFDLCIAGSVSRLRILALIPRFMNGTQEGHSAIQMVRARKVQVTAVNGSIPAHADGETLCEAGQQLSAEILPQSIELCVSSNERGA